jgi:type I restriction enzyme S subunit
VRADWSTAKLSDVCLVGETVNPGRAPDVEFDYVDVSSVSNETFSITGSTRLLGAVAPSRARRKIAHGDVIFATVRPTLRRIAQVAAKLDGAVCSTGFIVLRAGPRLDAKFLFYSLFRPEFMDAMEQSQAGASYPAVTDKQVLNQSIPVPPLEEQKRIVAVLDEAFAALDRARVLAEANLADAEEAFETGLDKIIAEQGNGAAETTLGTICSFENGDRGKNYPGRKAFVPEGVPFINAGHLEDGRIDWAAMNFIPEEHYHRLGNGKVKPNDLLFCLRGSLGKFGTVDREGLGAIASSLVIVRAKEPVLTDFISIYFRSKTCKQMISDYAGGAAQPNLSAGDLKKFKILLPDKVSQRRTIEMYNAFADTTHRLRSSYAAKLLDVAELRQSLLQKAFAGELT